MIDENGLRTPSTAKIRIIQNAQQPTNINQFIAYLGILNYYVKLFSNAV